jgi:uncharacterized membrane protein YdcZ (DUF606 family)
MAQVAHGVMAAVIAAQVIMAVVIDHHLMVDKVQI